MGERPNIFERIFAKILNFWIQNIINKIDKKVMAKQKDQPEEKKIEPVNKKSPSEEVLERLTKSTHIMKQIKSQFGYSGYSNPNFINLVKEIEHNEKFLEGLK